jgi:hypothetical protein
VKHVLFGLTVLAGVTFLAACSGGTAGKTTLVPSAPSAAKRGTGTVSFVINVPQQSSQSTSAARQGTRRSASSVRPQYISPATQSMTVNITGGPDGTYSDNQTADLTIGSSGCTSTLASVICTLSIPGLQPCNSSGAGSGNCYTATLTTYDQAGGAGNVLSEAQAVAFAIVAGQTNTVALTLSGIPESILATALNGGSGQVLVQALDADDNIIVGPGSPSFSISQTAGALSVTLTQPTAASPNIFVAAPSSSGSATLQVTASYSDSTCSLAGAVCTADFTLSATGGAQNLFVSNSSANTVTIYAAPYTGTPTTVSNGVNDPEGIAVDNAGNLFVANFGGFTVTEYAPPYTGSPTTITNGPSFPYAIALDASGDLFVGNWGDGVITEYTAGNYAGTPVSISQQVYDPTAFLFDSSNNLYALDYSGEQVSIYPSSDYTTNSPTVLDVGGYHNPVYGLALNSSNDVFVGEAGADAVAEYAPPYSGTPATPIATVTSGVDLPDALALNASGNLFVANYNGNTVTEYAYSGGTYSNSPTTISNGVGSPSALLFDSSNDLFVGNSGSVTEYAPPYTGSPTTISNGVNSPGQLVIAKAYTISISPGT